MLDVLYTTEKQNTRPKPPPPFPARLCTAVVPSGGGKLDVNNAKRPQPPPPSRPPTFCPPPLLALFSPRYRRASRRRAVRPTGPTARPCASITQPPAPTALTRPWPPRCDPQQRALNFASPARPSTPATRRCNHGGREQVERRKRATRKSSQSVSRGQLNVISAGGRRDMAPSRRLSRCPRLPHPPPPLSSTSITMTLLAVVPERRPRPGLVHPTRMLSHPLPRKA